MVEVVYEFLGLEAEQERTDSERAGLTRRQLLDNEHSLILERSQKANFEPQELSALAKLVLKLNHEELRFVDELPVLNDYVFYRVSRALVQRSRAGEDLALEHLLQVFASLDSESELTHRVLELLVDPVDLDLGLIFGALEHFESNTRYFQVLSQLCDVRGPHYCRAVPIGKLKGVHSVGLALVDDHTCKCKSDCTFWQVLLQWPGVQVA